jgi:ABC-type Fe3+ transport system permease subunit
MTTMEPRHIPRVAGSLDRKSAQDRSNSMRAKTSTVLFTSAVKLAGHATMGLAMGLAFAFFVTRFDPLGIMALIRGDMVPGMTPSILVGIMVLSFTVGTTLTGFVFMITEDR